MKRRNREINIFNMSTIDLFACAMGAFLLLTLILMPYYLNIDRSYLDVISNLESQLEESNSRLQQVTSDLDSAGDALSACEANVQQAENELAQSSNLQGQIQAQLENCRGIEKRNFLLVTMSWGTTDDVDLHVIDPAGNRFFYKTRFHDGSRGGLELDSTRGPGNEIWLHPEATPGTYEIYYNFFNRQSDKPQVKVRGTVYHQGGSIEIPDAILNSETGQNHDAAPLVTTVRIDNDGNISLQ